MAVRPDGAFRDLPERAVCSDGAFRDLPERAVPSDGAFRDLPDPCLPPAAGARPDRAFWPDVGGRPRRVIFFVMVFIEVPFFVILSCFYTNLVFHLLPIYVPMKTVILTLFRLLFGPLLSVGCHTSHYRSFSVSLSLL